MLKEILLQEAPEGYIEETEGEEEAKQWKITNDQAADWWIEVKGEELKEIARLKEGLENKIAFYQEKLRKLKNEEEAVKSSMEAKLLEYFETIPDEQKIIQKTQDKYRLPSGEIIKKYPSPKVKQDHKQLSEWLKSNELEEYITVEPKVKWGDLKKDLADRIIFMNEGYAVDADTGEVIDGLIVEPRPPKVEIKLD